jgi:hypothetical protein
MLGEHNAGRLTRQAGLLVLSFEFLILSWPCGDFRFNLKLKIQNLKLRCGRSSMVERKPSNPIRAILTENNFPKLQATTRNLTNVFNGIPVVAFFAGGNFRKPQNTDFSASGCKNGMQKLSGLSRDAKPLLASAV